MDVPRYIYALPVDQKAVQPRCPNVKDMLDGISVPAESLGHPVSRRDRVYEKSSE